MPSALWHRAAIILSAVTLLSAADDARQQLIEQFNTRAFTMLDQRVRTVAAITTREAAEKRRAEVRAKVLRSMNGLPNQRGPLNAHITGTLARDRIRIEKLTFESLPGYTVTADLYLPAAITERIPAVLMTPGHGATGKAGEYNLAANFARNGIAALAYDVMGQGERLQYGDPATGKSKVGGPTAEHSQAAIQTDPLGEHVSRYFVWDAMRALDYLANRREIDPAHLGAFGCSGGGTVTAYVAALDDRVKAAATACYITSFRELLVSKTGVQEAEQTIPGFIANGLDFADWVELAAPHPYAIVSTTEDMFPIEGARATFAEAQRFYSLYNASADIEHIIGPGTHGQLVPVHPRILAFFLRHLKNSSIEPSYERLTAPPPADLYAAGGQVHGTTIGDLIKQRAATLRTPVNPTDFRTPANITARPGAPIGDTPGQLFVPDAPDAPPYPAVLVVSGDPPADISSIPRGRLVLVIHPRPWPAGTESAKSPMQGTFNFLNLRAQLIGQTLVGLRADDIIHAIDFLAARRDVNRNDISAYSAGPGALALLHAAALDTRIKRVVIDRTLSSFRDIATEPMHTNVAEYLIPGVLQHYDIPDLIKAIAPRKVEVFHPETADAHPNQ